MIARRTVTLETRVRPRSSGCRRRRPIVIVRGFSFMSRNSIHKIGTAMRNSVAMDLTSSRSASHLRPTHEATAEGLVSVGGHRHIKPLYKIDKFSFAKLHIHTKLGHLNLKTFQLPGNFATCRKSETAFSGTGDWGLTFLKTVQA